MWIGRAKASKIQILPHHMTHMIKSSWFDEEVFDGVSTTHVSPDL